MENQLATKKDWKTPELIVMDKEIIQGSIFAGNDGNGNNTGS